MKADTKLKFEEHVETLCKKDSEKINALARISSYMIFRQRKLVVSHFPYCPIAWMFHSRWLNNRINNINERVLRIVYQDYETSFTDLLAKDISLTL